MRRRAHRSDRPRRSSLPGARGSGSALGIRDSGRFESRIAESRVPWSTRLRTGALIDKVAARQGVPARLVRAVIAVESAGNRRPVAKGRDGADAVDAADCAPIHSRQSRTIPLTNIEAGINTCVTCSIDFRWHWRWRRTTPARRPSSDSAAFRPFLRPNGTFRASSDSPGI